MKRKTKRLLKLAALNIAFILLCLLTLVPIYYAFTVSINAQNAVLSSQLSLFPRETTLQNYATILFEKPFLVWLKNSALLSAASVLFALAVAVPGAYAFSRFNFRGKGPVLRLLLLLNAFPAILSMFAIYRLLNLLGLVGTYAGLVIIYTGTMGIFGLWNMKGYFDSIPVDIEEAAKIDGANDLQLVTRIVLPLAKPSIIVTAVMILIYVWNEYIFAVTFMTDSSKYTLAAGLYSLQATDYTRNWPLFSAASLIVSLPIIIIFFIVQKHMVSGLTAGGVKG